MNKNTSNNVAVVSNGYPSSFVQKISKARTAPKKEPVAEFKSTAVLPYVQGVSEPLRRCLEQQGIRTVFKSETTLRSHLVRPKDIVDPAKQDGVVYRIPCECGKVYIGETGRSMHETESKNTTGIYDSPVPRPPPFLHEHAHKTGHYPLWNEVKFIDRDPHWYTRRVKEAVHIRLHTLITSTGIAELKFPKRGCPRSRNTTGKRYNNGPLRKQLLARTVSIEMHQSQHTSVI